MPEPNDKRSKSKTATKWTQSQIIIVLNPARVVSVQFVADHVLEQRLLFEVWPTIKPHLDRIDRALRQTMVGVLRELRQRNSDDPDAPTEMAPPLRITIVPASELSFVPKEAGSEP